MTDIIAGRGYGSGRLPEFLTSGPVQDDARSILTPSRTGGQSEQVLGLIGGERF